MIMCLCVRSSTCFYCPALRCSQANDSWFLCPIWFSMMALVCLEASQSASAPTDSFSHLLKSLTLTGRTHWNQVNCALWHRFSPNIHVYITWSMCWPVLIVKAECFPCKRRVTLWSRCSRRVCTRGVKQAADIACDIGVCRISGHTNESKITTWTSEISKL